jgi:hypothetical protein
MVDVEAFPDEPQVRMSRAFAESDALLASVSSALTDETMMYPRLVAAVRVHASITLIVQMNLVKSEVRLCLTDLILLSPRKNLRRNGGLALTLPS